MEQRHVLLVEDSDDDAFLFARALRESEASVTLKWASDAGEARELLRNARPSLIALDCDLPGIGGLELLRELRMDEEYRRIPIVMLSGTTADIDIELAYAFGANSFLTKPTAYQDYIDQILILLHYWLVANRTSLPSDDDFQQVQPLGRLLPILTQADGIVGSAKCVRVL